MTHVLTDQASIKTRLERFKFAGRHLRKRARKLVRRNASLIRRLEAAITSLKDTPDAR